jgi:hypothetical protein
MNLGFEELATPGLIALGSAVGALGTWVLNMKRVSAHSESERTKLMASVHDAELAERATFRTLLLREVSEMRGLIKECEVDRDALRKRLSETEKNVLLLQATSEITDKWLLFFKDHNALRFATEVGLDKPSLEAIRDALLSAKPDIKAAAAALRPSGVIARAANAAAPSGVEPP